MADSVLTRLAFDLNAAPLHPSPLQAQVDGLVGRFVEEAASPTTLGALMAGGLAYRLTRVGVLGLGSSRLLRPISVGAGLASEVSAYEFTTRTLLTLSPHPGLHASRFWSWSGPGGLREGLISSAVTFGILKGAGFLARGNNLVLQHAFQSTAMVAGHQTTALFGLTPRPEGSLAEQLLHAEATNLQLGAGISLVHAIAPGIHALERGLDLSTSLRPSASSEGFFRPFAQEMSSADARTRFSPSAPEKNPQIALMTSGDPPDGSGKGGRGGEGGPPDPARTKTLPGVDVRRPSQTGLSRISFRVEGFPETAPMLAARREGRIPFNELLEGIQTHFKTRGGFLTVNLSGDVLSHREQADLRVDLNRIFREANAPEGAALAIFSSTQLKAVIFRKRGGFLQIEEGKVKMIMVPTSGTSSQMKIAEAPKTTLPYGMRSSNPVPRAANSQEIETLLDSVLQGENPTLQFTGDQWSHAREATQIVEWLEQAHRLPHGKTLTLLVEKQPGLQVIFHWGTEERDRDQVFWKTERTEDSRVRPPSSAAIPTLAKPAEARRPTRPLIPPPSLPLTEGRGIVEKQGPDVRSDQVQCGTPTEVFAALRGFLNRPKGDYIPAPAIRLVRGHLTSTDLSSIAKVFGEQEFRWPEGYKILIHWIEAPSGLITLQRQGDLISVEIKGLQWKSRNFLFLREMPRSGQWGIYEPQQVRLYPLEAGSDYEKEMDTEIGELTQRIWSDEANSPYHHREEGSSFRGAMLARLAVHLLKNRSPKNPNFSPHEWEWVEGIHQQLEKAYTFLDFDTLRIFTERVGEERLRGYRSVLEQLNQKLKAEGRPWLVPLEEMAIDLPGAYVIPEKDHLRQPLVRRVFHSRASGRSPRENLALLNDPVRLGDFFRLNFEDYIRTLLPEMEVLKNRAKEAGHKNLPLKDSEALDQELAAQRDRFLIHYQDLADYRRILTEGWGNFRVDFLRTAFNEHRPLHQLYSTLYFRVGELSGELQRQVNLPSVEQIERMTRVGSRP